jgi:hypothetical protein
MIVCVVLCVWFSVVCVWVVVLSVFVWCCLCLLGVVFVCLCGCCVVVRCSRASARVREFNARCVFFEWLAPGYLYIYI